MQGNLKIKYRNQCVARRVKGIFRLLITPFILFLTLNQLNAFQISETRRDLTTSIIIPCHYAHTKYLVELLESYAFQTVVPDEVVISISEAFKPESLKIINNLETIDWPFKLNIIKSIRKVSEGGNRNIACAHATGNVLICSDADDLPHPQRVEVIKYFFENYNIDFLIHKFCHDFSPIDPNFEKIPKWVPRLVNEFGSDANGVVAITPKLFRKIKWDEAFKKEVDADFNQRSYNSRSNCMIIDAPLYLYRSYLSTYSKR